MSEATMEAPAANTAEIAQDFAGRHGQQLTPEQLDRITGALQAETESYNAKGSIVGVGIYTKVDITLKRDHGKTFRGSAWGVSTPDLGGMFGAVYTADLERLYEHTHAFEMNAVGGYFNVLFFDHHSNLLGHFQAAMVGVAVGVSGGTGKWS